MWPSRAPLNEGAMRVLREGGCPLFCVLVELRNLWEGVRRAFTIQVHQWTMKGFLPWVDGHQWTMKGIPSMCLWTSMDHGR